MNVYIVESDTNYGTVIYIVEAPDMEEAKLIAEEEGAWPNGDITELYVSGVGVLLYSGGGDSG